MDLWGIYGSTVGRTDDSVVAYCMLIGYPRVMRMACYEAGSLPWPDTSLPPKARSSTPTPSLQCVLWTSSALKRPHRLSPKLTITSTLADEASETHPLANYMMHTAIKERAKAKYTQKKRWSMCGLVPTPGENSGKRDVPHFGLLSQPWLSCRRRRPRRRPCASQRHLRPREEQRRWASWEPFYGPCWSGR